MKFATALLGVVAVAAALTGCASSSAPRIPVGEFDVIAVTSEIECVLYNSPGATFEMFCFREASRWSPEVSK